MTHHDFSALDKRLDRIAQLQEKNQIAINELVENTKKHDLQLAKTDAQLEKTIAKVDKLSTMYGGVANNQGAVAEEFYINSLQKNPTLNGMTFDTLHKNLNGHRNNIQDEFDIVLVNGIAVFIIEVKYKAHANDVDRLINKKSQNFSILFPQYKHYKKYLGLASFNINDETKSNALSQGVTVLQRDGNIIVASPGAAIKV